MDPSRAARNRWWLMVLAVAFVAIGMASRLRPETLAPIIELRFPDVEWVDAETLSQSMQAPESAAPLLLDVRSEEEFAVSHLRLGERGPARLQEWPACNDRTSV